MRIKNWLTFINEALGVPSGILEAAEVCVDRIYSEMQNLFDSDDFKKLLLLLAGQGDISVFNKSNGDSTYTFSITTPGVQVSDMKIKMFRFMINVTEKSSVNTLSLDSFSYFIKLEANSTLTSLVKEFQDATEIGIYIDAPIDTTYAEVYHFLEANKDQMLSSLTHELKHVYDFFKREKTSISLWGRYKMSDYSTDIDAIDAFLASLYYFNSIESLTRSSEFAMRLRRSNVTKATFMNFLRGDKIWWNIDGQKMAWNEFKKDIAEDPDTDSWLMLKGIDTFGMSDEEKADAVMTIVWSDLKNMASNMVHQIALTMRGSTVVSIMADSNLQRKIQSNITKTIESKSPQEFFDYWQKYFAKEAESVKRKLGRLWATLD
jgi:hypothetical protein